jgi:hypothetical protein
LVDWGDIIRKTFYDGGIEEIISTRRLVHIIRAYSIFQDKAKAIQVCVNRFDDETKQAFLELYDKVDADFVMPTENSEPKLTVEYTDTGATGSQYGTVGGHGASGANGPGYP